MAKNIRVILIDPESATVQEKFIAPTFEKGFYPLLDCDMIEAAYPEVLTETKHFIYCDEEGTFKPRKFYFEVVGYPQPLTGKAAIVKAGKDGETDNCTLSIAEAKKYISFL